MNLHILPLGASPELQAVSLVTQRARAADPESRSVCGSLQLAVCLFSSFLGQVLEVSVFWA